MKVITMESSAFTAMTEQIAEIADIVRAVSGESKGRRIEAETETSCYTTREAAHMLNVSKPHHPAYAHRPPHRVCRAGTR